MLHIFEKVDSLLDSLAEFIIEQCAAAIKRNGKFSIGLSGGSSPQKLYALLASDKYRNRIQWDKVLFFFGDERYVPADDKQSNYRMVRETLFTPLAISPDHVFPVDTILTPVLAAEAYEKVIREQLGASATFDLILLGLGDDAHTASLFPHTTVLSEKDALIKEVFVKKVNQYRITFTEPLINASRNVCFLVYGESKAEAVHHILKDAYQPEEYPGQLIKPVAGELHWFLDTAAASRVV